jgi:hypothetical protein
MIDNKAETSNLNDRALLAEDPFDLLAELRPRSRAVAVSRVKDQSHTSRHLKKSPSAKTPYHGVKEGLLCWFENTNNPTWTGNSDQVDI